MKFDLENIFKNYSDYSDEEYLKWYKFIAYLIGKYTLATDTIEVDGRTIKVWCYDDDLATLFDDNGIGVGRSFNVEKVFDYNEDYEPVGLDYGDYIETVELHQNGNTYLVPVYCAFNGCGCDYAFAIFEAKKAEKGE